MDINKSIFKGKTFIAILELVKLVWLKVTSTYVLLSISTYFILILFSMFILGYDSFESDFIEILTKGYSEFNLWLQARAVEDPKVFLISYVGFLLTVIIPSSWVTYFMFLIVNEQIIYWNLDLILLFKKSFNKRVFMTAGLFITLYLIFAICGMVAVLIGALTTPYLLIPFAIILLIFVFKFTLVFPAYVFGEKGFQKSFIFSFTHMTLRRCLTILVYLIPTGIILTIVILVLNVVVGAIIEIEYVGLAIQTIFQFIITGILTSFIIAAVLGIYYRYEDEKLDDQVDILDHLVNDM